MKSRQEVIKAFAELPDDVTTREIADATGRSVPGVQNWITHDPTFPGESAPRQGRKKFRSRDAVQEWYLAQRFASEDRPGPRAMSEAARHARPEADRMNIKELSDVLGVTPAGVRYHITAHQPGESDDPFPAAGEDGKRSWTQVRAWLLRNDDPLPEPDDSGKREWPEVRAWLLRNLDDGEHGQGTRDVQGMTLGRHDLIERARAAKAAGEKIPVEWLSEMLGIDDTRQVARLLRGAPAKVSEQPKRLRPTALARTLGVTVSQVKHYERTYTSDHYGDPFPAKDDTSAREVDEVRAWLTRNGKSFSPAA